MMTFEMDLFDHEQIDMLREALGSEELSEMYLKLPMSIDKAQDTIDAAIANEDLQAIKRAGHALKGVAGSFAAVKLQDVARRFELDVKSVEEARECRALLQSVARSTVAALPTIAT